MPKHRTDQDENENQDGTEATTLTGQQVASSTTADSNWTWDDASQVNFRAVKRISVHDEDAREQVTEARMNGSPGGYKDRTTACYICGMSTKCYCIGCNRPLCFGGVGGNNTGKRIEK